MTRVVFVQLYIYIIMYIFFPFQGSAHVPYVKKKKDYTTRDKYAEQSSAEQRRCFAIATPTLRAAQTCFVIRLIGKHILIQIYSLYI